MSQEDDFFFFETIYASHWLCAGWVGPFWVFKIPYLRVTTSMHHGTDIKNGEKNKREKFLGYKQCRFLYLPNPSLCTTNLQQAAAVNNLVKENGKQDSMQNAGMSRGEKER